MLLKGNNQNKISVTFAALDDMNASVDINKSCHIIR
jgi:hypothetical protein